MQPNPNWTSLPDKDWPDIASFYKCNSIYSRKRWKKTFSFAATDILFQPTILGLKSTQIAAYTIYSQYT